MQETEFFALTGAWLCGALTLLHGAVWRAHRERWSLEFALAYLLLAVRYGFDAQLQPAGLVLHPVGATLGAASAACLTLGMIDYVGLRGRRAVQAQLLTLGIAVAAAGLAWSRQVPRGVIFAVLSGYTLAQALLALRAALRDRGRGHGLVFIALISNPVLIALVMTGVVDGGMVRYLIIGPVALVGMTVLTTGLLRAQLVAGDELLARQNAEDALRRANDGLELRVAQRTAELNGIVAALESFNRSISHDLRGPLGGIAGLSRLVEEALASGDTATALRLVPAITRQADSSAELVESLLALARVNDTVLAPQPVALNQVVDETLEQLRLADPAHAALPVQVGSLPTVCADPGLLRQVYVNLIGNAVKFSRGVDRPQVELGAFAEDGGHVMFVRDNGVGFADDAASHLFEPFQRLESAGRFPGNGVGLSIVKRIVERHGGRVWASSKPQCGATFYFWLGAASPAP